jgi:hypothetical protein
MATYNREQNSNSTLNDVSVSTSVHEQVYLDKISYQGGEVKFEHAFDRIDFQLEPRLKTIYINKNGVNESKWVFDYGYFTANTASVEIPTLTDLKRMVDNFNNYYNELLLVR